MATKKYLELQDYSDTDLVAELEKTQKDYQKLRFDHAIKGLDNGLVLREVRRDIARLNTELRRREIAAMDEKATASRSKIRARRRKNK